MEVQHQKILERSEGLVSIKMMLRILLCEFQNEAIVSKSSLKLETMATWYLEMAAHQLEQLSMGLFDLEELFMSKTLE